MSFYAQEMQPKLCSFKQNAWSQPILLFEVSGSNYNVERCNKDCIGEGGACFFRTDQKFWNALFLKEQFWLQFELTVATSPLSKVSILNRLGFVSTQLRGDLGKMLQFLERRAAGMKIFELGERLRVSLVQMFRHFKNFKYFSVLVYLNLLKQLIRSLRKQQFLMWSLEWLLFD